jgi:transposase
MLLERQGIKIFVYREAIDMRAGFERLHEYCVGHMQATINEGNAYVFFGKNRSRLKLLVYDGSGLVLVAKRIERKNFMSHAELLGRSEISMEELRLIFHGGVIRRPVFGAEAERLERGEKPSVLENFLSTQRERLALPTGVMNDRP